MDIATLATAAMTLLTPYLTKAAEKFSEKAGENLWSKVKNVFTKENEKELVQKVEENNITKSDLAAIESSLIERLHKESNFEQLIRKSLNITPTNEFILENLQETAIKIRKELKSLYKEYAEAGINLKSEYLIRIKQQERKLKELDEIILSIIAQ